MAKNFNYKKLKAVSDSQKQRVSDMRSGGSGSLRSSIFSRIDETVTDDMVDMFLDNFAPQNKVEVDGGDYDDSGKKQVIWYKTQIPDKVQVGNVEALLAKVDYDKDKHIFTALYRPKNGKWGQSKKTGKRFK